MPGSIIEIQWNETLYKVFKLWKGLLGMPTNGVGIHAIVGSLGTRTRSCNSWLVRNAYEWYPHGSVSDDVYGELTIYLQIIHIKWQSTGWAGFWGGVAFHWCIILCFSLRIDNLVYSTCFHHFWNLPQASCLCVASVASLGNLSSPHSLLYSQLFPRGVHRQIPACGG